MLKQCFKHLSILFVLTLLVACSGTPKKPVIVIEKISVNTLPVLSEAEKASYQKALKFLSQEEFSQAELLFNDLVEKQPMLTGAFVNLGVIKKKSGQLEEAKTFFLKALEINPNFIDALLQQSLMYQDSGEFTKAEDLLRRAEAVQPNHPLVNYNLGVLYELYLQEYSLAIKYYQRYISVSNADDVEMVKRWVQLLERK
jgi:Tfp pilus assembly protein PilF|tara:strand:+ start:939 stop:1535 length:597 start_codon:yes stop_codon:yes gene_type:complete